MLLRPLRAVNAAGQFPCHPERRIGGATDTESLCLRAKDCYLPLCTRSRPPRLAIGVASTALLVDFATQTTWAEYSVPQHRLPAGHRNLPSGDENSLHIGLDVQWIAVGHDHVGGLSHIERAQLVRDTPNFRRIQGDGLERFVMREAERSRVARGIRQVAHSVSIVGRKCNLHSALVQLAGQFVDRIVTFDSSWGFRRWDRR